MKRVLFIAKVVKLHINHFHLPYFKWLKENGYEVHVCALNDYEPKKECAIPYCDAFFDVPFKESPLSKDNYQVYKIIKSIVKENHYDIIHCHTAIGGAIGRLASKKARENGTKIIYTAHGFSFYKGAPLRNWCIYYPIEYYLSKFTDVLITINREDNVVAHKMQALKVVQINGVGVELDIEQLNENKIQAIKQQLNVQDRDFVLLSVGELNKNKNHEVIIRTIAKMDDDHIKYLICGQGKLKEYLENLINELAVEKQVYLLGYKNNIKEILQVCDAFIFPSHREGLSLSVMEAMVAKKPIICSDIRGNNDLIDHNLGGFLVSKDDFDEYEKYIKKVANMNVEVFGEYNLEKVKKYKLDSCVKNMGVLYETLLGEGKRND